MVLVSKSPLFSIKSGAGDFIPIEEPKEQPKISTRLPCEDVEGDQSDDEERMDMNDITGRKEREERREQFYAVENDCMYRGPVRAWAVADAVSSLMIILF